MRAALAIALLAACACACNRKPATDKGGAKADPAPAVLAGPAGPEAESGHKIRTLASGPTQMCALYTNGTVACWGETARATLGVTGSVDVPVRIPDVRGATQIAVGSCHGCALGRDGRVACWGYKLPPGAPEPKLVPGARACDEKMAPFAPHPVAVAAAELPRLRALASNVEPHSTWTAGLAEDDRRFVFGAWLSPDSGKVMMSAVAPRADEAGIHAPGALRGAVAITSGAAPCARFADGHARCWTAELAPAGGTAAPSLEAPAGPVLDIAQGALDDERCFVLASGKVECRWMRGVVEVPHLSDARSVALSNVELCALRANGTLACFDYAPGSVTPKPRALQGVRAIAASGDRICALGEADAVRCWQSQDIEPRVVAMP